MHLWPLWPNKRAEMTRKLASTFPGPQGRHVLRGMGQGGQERPNRPESPYCRSSSVAVVPPGSSVAVVPTASSVAVVPTSSSVAVVPTGSPAATAG